MCSTPKSASKKLTFNHMKYLALFVCFLSIAACKNNSNSTNVSNKSEDSADKTILIEKPSMEDADKYVGKKPSEVNLFSQYNLTNRIEALLKNDSKNFTENFNDETPIMRDGELLYFVGCKAGDCKAMKFFVILDLIETNINILVINNGTPKSYEESAIIGMTDNIAKAFQNILTSPGL